MSEDAPVFSTASGDSRKKNKDKSKKESQGKNYKRGTGPVKIRLEKKKRGGKLVTVLTDIPLNESEASELLKEMKAKMGCGGSLKGSQMEFQGDRCKQIHEMLTTRQVKSKIC